MFEIPSLDKYRFYVTKDRVIAVSSYAGRPVRGVAKCASGDKFDVNIGKELAAARCNQKIANKRKKRALMKYEAATTALRSARRHVYAMHKYYTDAWTASQNAEKYTNEILNRV